MTTRLPVAGLLAFGAAAALTACSSTTSGHGSSPQVGLPSTPLTSVAVSSAPATKAATPAALPDACKLLTPAEARVLAGVPLTAPQDTRPTAADPIGMCEWDAPVTGPSGSVQLFVQHDIPRALQIDKAIHHKFRTVPGIGDQTLEEPENASIFVRKDGVWVYLTTPYSATPALLERAARAIATRLP